MARRCHLLSDVADTLRRGADKDFASPRHHSLVLNGSRVILVHGLDTHHCWADLSAGTKPILTLFRPCRSRACARWITCSRTSWPEVPRPPLVPRESSLKSELTSIVLLEMADEFDAITGERWRSRGDTGGPISRTKVLLFLGQDARTRRAGRRYRRSSSRPAASARRREASRRGWPAVAGTSPPPGSP